VQPDCRSLLARAGDVLCFGELTPRGEEARRIFRQLERVVRRRQS